MLRIFDTHPESNQIRVVAFNVPQLTQASFLQKNQTLQNVFLISGTLRWHRASVACKNQNCGTSAVTLSVSYIVVQFVSFLAGLGQKSNLLCMVPNGKPYLLIPLAVMDLGLNHTSSGQPFGKRLV